MTDQADDGYTTKRCVFLGLRVVRRGGVADYIEQAHFRHADGEAVFDWSPKTFRGFAAGYNYDIPVKDRSFHFGRAEYVGPLDDAAERQAIAAAHHAHVAALAANKQREKLLKADRDLTDILRPLFKAYGECKTYEAQAAFEALVLAALRRNRGLG